MIPTPIQPLTVEDLIATLRANNGFVLKVETEGRMGAKCTALLPRQRVISPIMFQQLQLRRVLCQVSKVTKKGVTTITYRVV